MRNLLHQPKVCELRDPSEHGIEIHSDITVLIEEFAPNVKIKVKNTQKIEAYTKLSSDVIVLSTGLFNKFKASNIKVFVAHELGHIKHKNKFQKIKLVFFGIVGFLMGLFLIGYLRTTLVITAWGLGLLFVLMALFTYRFLSHSDEYRADNFAITKASISAMAFDQCFSKAGIILEEEYMNEQRLASSVKRQLANFTHPTITKRISRVHALHKTAKHLKQGAPSS
ncbi:MAG: M56 family metallopeptidase [Chloroflexi bacterium]|nr:M56 family metallopeptidase [Chloroflexota bacterium]